jgi:cytochrome c553
MNLVRIGGLALLTAAVSLGAWAATKAWAAHCGTGTTGSCTENVRETKHNLAANTDIAATGTTEVCVFCHTPHGGRTDVAGGGAPLWNRALPAGTGYTNYDSPNFDNQQGTLTSGPKGVSLACLSCHDGTIALDALINAPGSGGFVLGNRDGSLISSDPNISFSGGGVDLSSMREGNRPASTGTDPYLGGLNNFVSDGNATFGMEPFPNLTQDLRDDHPISMRMPAATVDPQFADALTNSTTTSANIRPVKRANTVLPTDKRDQIRLYNTDSNLDWVECASCHNPHTPRTTFLRLPSIAGGAGDGEVSPAYGTGATNPRTLNHEPNQGSLICLTCHQK